MSDGVIATLGSVFIAVLGVVTLLIRRSKPRPSKRDVGYESLWTRVDQQDEKIQSQGDRIEEVAGERDWFRSKFLTMSDGFDAMRAVISRMIPPPAFTRGEQDAIDRATAIRDDDSMWPTEQGRR